MPVFQSVEEVEHWLTPRENIITCYVVEVGVSVGGCGHKQQAARVILTKKLLSCSR